VESQVISVDLEPPSFIKRKGRPPREKKKKRGRRKKEWSCETPMQVTVEKEEERERLV